MLADEGAKTKQGRGTYLYFRQEHRHLSLAAAVPSRTSRSAYAACLVPLHRTLGQMSDAYFDNGFRARSGRIARAGLRTGCVGAEWATPASGRDGFEVPWLAKV